MAGASGKPTAVHFSLIFFVMTTIIAVAVAWVQTGQYTETKVQLETTQGENTNLTSANRTYIEEIAALKGDLGSNFNDVGAPDQPNTVRWDVAQQIRQKGAYPQGSQLPTVKATLAEMRQKLDDLQALYNKTNADLTGRDEELRGLRATYQQMVDAAKAGQSASENITADVQKDQKERLDAADKLYQDKVAELAGLRSEWEQDKGRYESEIAALKQEVKDLIVVNDRVQEKLNEVQKVSFEIADGEIRWVDHNSRLVWINVGADDRLTKRTTFSVYTKGHNGIGRGAEDIKGSIEVTRIIGPHLAEARLIDKDIYEPMAPGDPIYTPLWSPGRSEEFAIVGFIDADGDGRSDRDLITEHLKAAGASFAHEVLDDGTRLGEKIDVRTKFFVVADLPDPSTTADADEKKLYGTILKHFSDMQKEARQQGVRKISLSDFLAYIGYRPSRRLYRPGDGTPFKLKSGAASTATNETIGGRESSGQTSGVYSRSKRLKQPKSSGQTSKLFRGGGYSP